MIPLAKIRPGETFIVHRMRVTNRGEHDIVVGHDPPSSDWILHTKPALTMNTDLLQEFVRRAQSAQRACQEIIDNVKKNTTTKSKAARRPAGSRKAAKGGK